MGATANHSVSVSCISNHWANHPRPSPSHPSQRGVHPPLRFACLRRPAGKVGARKRQRRLRELPGEGELHLHREGGRQHGEHPAQHSRQRTATLSQRRLGLLPKVGVWTASGSRRQMHREGRRQHSCMENSSASRHHARRVSILRRFTRSWHRSTAHTHVLVHLVTCQRPTCAPGPEPCAWYHWEANTLRCCKPLLTSQHCTHAHSHTAVRPVTCELPACQQATHLTQKP